MSDPAWTMNCVLAGAKADRLLKEGKEKEARTLLQELSSELTPSNVEYLLFRLKEGN